MRSRRRPMRGVVAVLFAAAALLPAQVLPPITPGGLPPMPRQAQRPKSPPPQQQLDIPKLPEVRTRASNPAQSGRPAEADFSLGLPQPPVREFAPLATGHFDLPNGLHVVLHEDRRAPWIAGSLRVETGSAADPPLKAGLAELTLRTIRLGGARGIGKDAWQENLETLGAVLQADAGERSSALVFRCLSSNFLPVLEMVSKAMTDPAFDEDALEESRGALRSRVAGRNNTVEGIVIREVQAAALGEWMAPAADFSTLANTGPEDLRVFYRSHYGPTAATLIVTGDFAPAEVRGRIEALFGSWQTAAKPAAKPAQVTAPAAAGVRFAQLSRAQTAGFAFARIGPAAGSTAAAASSVLAELLTGGSSSRMALLGRSKSSWLLRTTAGFEVNTARPGLFSVRAICDTPYPVEAMKAILDDAALVRKGDFSDAAAFAARRTALGVWTAQFPNALSRLSFDEGARRAGLGADFAARHFKAMSEVKKADLVAAAQLLLDPAGLHAAVAANATLMNRPLTEFRAEIQPVDLSIRSAQPLQAITDPEAIARGKQWLARIQAALGGAEKLAAVKDLEILSKGTHHDVAVTITDRWIAPGILRQDQETQTGVTSVFYNGEIGWVGSAGRLSPLSQGMLGQVRGELLRLLPRLATSDRDPGRTVSHGGSNVLMITGERGTAVRIYVDEATNLPARLVYQSVSGAGLPATAEETWSDWIESGGLRFPGRIVLRVDGRRAGEVTVSSVKVDSGLKAADLERKP